MATKDKNTKKTMGKKPGSKDAEREAAGQEGQEVAGPGRAARSAENRVGCPVRLSRALLWNRAERPDG